MVKNWPMTTNYWKSEYSDNWSTNIDQICVLVCIGLLLMKIGLDYELPLTEALLCRPSSLQKVALIERIQVD